MKGENVVRGKRFVFAPRVARAPQFLMHEGREPVLSKQCLRSGTSVFISKMNIAYKEARETAYRIRLLQATDYLTDGQSRSLLADANELCKILSTIVTTKHHRTLNS